MNASQCTHASLLAGLWTSWDIICNAVTSLGTRNFICITNIAILGKDATGTVIRLHRLWIPFRVMIPTLCNILYNTLSNFISVARGCLQCLPSPNRKLLTGWPISGVNGVLRVLNVPEPLGPNGPGSSLLPESAMRAMGPSRQVNLSRAHADHDDTEDWMSTNARLLYYTYLAKFACPRCRPGPYRSTTVIPDIGVHRAIEPGDCGRCCGPLVLARSPPLLYPIT